MKKYEKKGDWKFFVGILIGAVLIIIFFVGLIFSENHPFANKIAVINIRGVISSSPEILSETFTTEDAFHMLKKVEEDPNIKGVLFVIDSPGGSVVASREIAYAVRDLNKPKLCWLGDIAASGAYWIASSCDHIMADPLTITGSIGVTASYLEFSKLFEKYGITYEQITSGERKDIGSPFRNLTEEERRKLQYITEEIFSYFINDIKKRRNLTEEQVNELSKGDVYLAKDAINLGLVDSLGTLKDAKEKIKKMCHVEKVEFIPIEKKSLSLLELLGLFG
ncbi:MAG: signal peptide peptidase SppA [Candidatus Aenigmatarchaeota archaeon]